MEMNFDQVTQLRAKVDELPRPKVKEYVCTMTKSFLHLLVGR
jgi:hypothetical protein